MRHPPRPFGSSLARAAACLVLTSACTTLRPVALDELRGPTPPDRVLVRLNDHSTLWLSAPKLVGDTLEGVAQGLGSQHILLSDAMGVREREAAPGRTA
ncbi:MAG TPA: hypothetical protein VN848_09855, partial [Gemmatimonadales bacterium]|nr:hypothetical protein [Gemmatimonadales bacterium]